MISPSFRCTCCPCVQRGSGSDDNGQSGNPSAFGFTDLQYIDPSSSLATHEQNTRGRRNGSKSIPSRLKTPIFPPSNLRLILFLSRFEIMSAARAKRGVLPPPQEVIEKLEKTVNDGNHYGALQMYKSYSVRYAVAERYTEALEILQSGALVQLNNGQVTCGAELAVLFVETLVKGKFPYNEETLGGVRKIYQAFPKLSVPQQLGDDDADMEKLQEAMVAAKVRVESCSTFLKYALKWSAEFGAPKGGSPQVHVMLAEYIYSECPELDMTKVSGHFIRGNDREKFASTLVNFMGKCYPGEDDLAIARAVLMYLSQGNLRDANYIMDEIKKQLESKNSALPQSELIKFIEYLLEMLERDAFPLFRILRQKYQSSIDREALFNELLDEIALKFYNIQRKSGLDSVFGDFFKMLGGVPT